MIRAGFEPDTNDYKTTYDYWYISVEQRRVISCVVVIQGRSQRFFWDRGKRKESEGGNNIFCKVFEYPKFVFN